MNHLPNFSQLPSFLSSISFIIGFSVALFCGALLKVLLGMQSKLYLISRESDFKSKSIIPLTSELKKRSFWKTLLKKNWKEDLDLKLADYGGKDFSFQINYNLWRGFNLRLKAEADCQLDRRKLIANKVYHLKSGTLLTTGDRSFIILITPESLETLNREEEEFQAQNAHKFKTQEFEQ